MDTDHRDELTRIREQTLTTQTTAYWIDALGKAGIPAGPVLSYEQVLNHPQIGERGLVRKPTESGEDSPSTMVAPITLSKTPVQLKRGAPTVGEHTGEIMETPGRIG